MIVSCPECGARYKLPDNAIPPDGRPMRCASCKHRWFEMGPEPFIPDAFTPQPVAPEPVAAPIEVEPTVEVETPVLANPSEDEDSVPRSHPVLKTVFAVLLGAAFTAGAAALWVPAMPPPDFSAVPWLEALVYPAATPPNALMVRFVTHPQPVAGGRTLYALTGTLTNSTDKAQPVPRLEGRLVDGAGSIDYRWQIAAPAAVLLPGQQVAFDGSALGAPGARVVVAH